MNEFNEAQIRGFSASTQYGLLNGWISELDIQETCDQSFNYRKVIAT